MRGTSRAPEERCEARCEHLEVCARHFTEVATWPGAFAEQAGFSIAMISDHAALIPDVHSAYPAPFYDPFSTLAWLAGETDSIRLGTTVAIVPFRHPLLTARIVASIDQFSGGRFVFGVGVG